MTAPFTDRQLSAFLAGTLDDDALAEAIETAINEDPALAERAEMLVVADQADVATVAVRDAFAAVLYAPVPERLAGIVNAPARAQSATIPDAGRAARSLPRPANDTGGTWKWPQFAAMAASLAIGALVGGPLLTGGNSENGVTSGSLVLAGADGLTTAPAVAAMLDTAPSGQAVELAQIGSGEVVLTFRNIDGQMCRQFTIDAVAGTSDALACAAAGGEWQVEAFGRRAQPLGEMRLAGGDAAVSVVVAVDEMIDGDPLVGDDELAELRSK